MEVGLNGFQVALTRGFFLDDTDLNIVTGAFGYTGKYITRRLLATGRWVRTLTGHPNRPNPFGEQVEIAPFNFDQPAALEESLRGAAAVYNTYWVRFSHGTATYEKAVENSKILIATAQRAGVRRFVHVSITNASEESPLPYFRGKGILENTLRKSGLSYAILRPAAFFGGEDVLINNIAWLLRRFPIFVIPGDGDYGIQPIHVEDMADLALSAAEEKVNVVRDAVGPERFSYEELVCRVAETVGSRARITHASSGFVLFSSKLLGWVLRDVVLTREEVEGLMANLLVSTGIPTGRTRLSDWLEQNREGVGRQYACELKRHYR